METSSVRENTTQVNTPTDLPHSQYPWTKTATVCLTKVDPLVIDIWTDAVHEYWCHDVGMTRDLIEPTRNQIKTVMCFAVK